MTEQTYTTWGSEGLRSGMPSLWRLAIWGTLASTSLFIAVISAYSSAGASRAAASAAASQPGSPPSAHETAQQQASMADLRTQSINNAQEARRLSEAVQALAADRDQLATRLAAIERNLESVTGSVKRSASTPPAPAAALSQTPQNLAPATSTAPAVRSEMPTTTGSTAATTTGSAASAPVAPPAPTPAPSGPEAAMATAQPAKLPSGQSEAAKGPAAEAGNRVVASTADPPRSPGAAGAESPPTSELGVDVGGAANFDALRALWHTTKNNDPSLLDDFYPVVATRENSRTHAPELRLIVGPMPDAEAAAQLCITLAAAHQYCQPVAFEGQRLSLADATAGKGAHHRAPVTQPVTGLKLVPAYPAGK